MPVDISVIILTYNEECNIGAALRSACGWAKDVFVVDSYSKDATLEICRQHPCRIFEHEFIDQASQFNWTLSHLPITTEWMFFLDADEWMPVELKEEIQHLIERKAPENGFLLRWRFIWMGKWVKRGYYPKWLTRLVRYGKAHWETRAINPHLVVEGAVGQLQHDFIHDNQKGLQDWLEKHIRYARNEAEQLLIPQSESKYLTPSIRGSQAQRTRWIRVNIYNRLPVIVRPCLYFFYRTIVRGGILDGGSALLYHFLHAFWCPLLIDVFYLELRAQQKASTPLRETTTVSNDRR